MESIASEYFNCSAFSKSIIDNNSDITSTKWIAVNGVYLST